MLEWIGRPLPEVLVLGAMRCGTSFLRANLRARPGLAVTAIAEPQFFSCHWHRGLAEYRRQLPKRLPRSLYRTVGRKRALAVDVTPYYLFHPQAAARAASVLRPDSKFIVLLREPGARAWSHYKHSLMRGSKHLGFMDALAAEPQRLATALPAALEAAEGPSVCAHQAFSYAARGRYAEQLQVWWNHFSRRNFLLLKSADLFQRPVATLDRASRFLQLEATGRALETPLNTVLPAPMPAPARDMLDRIFAAPNRNLQELTGICFDDV